MMQRTRYPIRRGPRGGHDRSMVRQEPLPEYLAARRRFDAATAVYDAAFALEAAR